MSDGAGHRSDWSLLFIAAAGLPAGWSVCGPARNGWHSDPSTPGRLLRLMGLAPGCMDE